jgi:hypothetical protein
MIIKVPLYFEVEGKFKPEQSRKISEEVRLAVSTYFSKVNGGSLRVSGHESVKSLKILSETEVRQRLTRDVQIVENSD